MTTSGWPIPLNNAVGTWEWLHPTLSNQEAAALVADHSSSDGAYLVRTRGPEHPKDYVITVTYKGRATHHLVSQDDDGVMAMVNKSGRNRREGFISIWQLVNALKTPQGKWWPVSMNNPVPAGGNPAPVDGGGSGGGPTNWLHPMMTNEKANALLMEQLSGEGKGIDGTFLVRVYGDGLFALSVVYRGKPTHHRTKSGEPFVINSMTIDGCNTLKEVVAKLSKANAQPKWPVPLKYPILYDGDDPLGSAARTAADATAAVAEAAAAEAAAAEAEAEAVAAVAKAEAAAAAAEAAAVAAEAEAAAAAEDEARHRRESEAREIAAAASTVEKKAAAEREAVAAKAAAADAARNQKSSNDAARRQQQEADDAARKQQDADDAAQKQKDVDNGVPGKDLLDGAALMQFEKLNINRRDSDTHLDRAELGHLDEATVRKMDANKDGTVGVMEFMQHKQEEAAAAADVRYGNFNIIGSSLTHPSRHFDIILGHVLRVSLLHPTPRAPCAMLYLVPVLIVC